MESIMSNLKHTTALVPTSHTIPYRQIRAFYDSETITVYQAYNAEIAAKAVKHQRLNASPLFKPNRMTWIKPSWCWMMYRAGYSFKDKNQERILALRMKHEDFLDLLEKGVLTTELAKPQYSDSDHVTAQKEGEKILHVTAAPISKPADVRIQWDPERSPRIRRLDYRSIQIGIPGALQTEWVEKRIVGIEDVTERARGLKQVLDESPEITDQELLKKGVLPEERELKVPDKLQRILELG